MKRGKHLIQSDNQRRRQGSEMWWKSNLKKTNFEKDKSEKDKSGGNPQLFHGFKSGKHHTTGRSQNIGDNHRWELEERVALLQHKTAGQLYSAQISVYGYLDSQVEVAAFFPAAVSMLSFFAKKMRNFSANVFVKKQIP